MSDDESDRALLARHVEGDPDAFAALVRRHRDRLWAVAIRTTGDPEEAADALQDALLSAHRAAAGFRAEAKVSTWLHRIVVNACLDRLRRRQARPTLPLLEGVDPPAPGDAVDSRMTALTVTAALAQLPEETRTALVLVDLEGLPVDEVAALLGVPAGTVKSRCSRGRARLAVLLVTLDPRTGGNRGGLGSVGPRTQRAPDPDPGSDQTRPQRSAP